jgi:hypothetical protein
MVGTLTPIGAARSVLETTAQILLVPPFYENLGNWSMQTS